MIWIGLTEKVSNAMLSGPFSPRHGASSDGGWRRTPPDNGEQLKIY
jgi:hypothetical protein